MSFEDQARAAGYDVTAPPLRGGSGLVYRAIESATGAPVAIKALAPGFDIERLRREAEILARIDHPNVATLRAFTLIDQNPALIVDWVDGLPLSGLIKRGQPLPRQQAFAIFEQIADAMTAVHDAGVIHRDLSPANVLVDQNDVVTVIDFGGSRSMDSATVTVEGMVAGTPRYLAPEVIEGADPTVGSDQYSAAIILHELLTGSWPFPEGDAIATAFHHQLHTAPKPLDEVQPDLPSGIGDAVLQALEKDPADPSSPCLRSSGGSTNRRRSPAADGAAEPVPPQSGSALASLCCCWPRSSLRSGATTRTRATVPSLKRWQRPTRTSTAGLAPMLTATSQTTSGQRCR
jgi:serine/threonine-protein kinase